MPAQFLMNPTAVPAHSTLPAGEPATRRRLAAAGGRGVLWWLAMAIAALVLAPVVAVAARAVLGWLGPAEGSPTGTWAHLLATVLPGYVGTTFALCAGVAVGVSALGVGAAWLVTRYDFAGRRHLEWALVLPLAMPAYVMAYAYTDWLQFVGPVQTSLRELTGWTRADYRFPDVRSTGGAVLMFSLVLYPYVYLLARTAFLERAGGLAEVGRTLGLSPRAVFWRLSLPLARPAIVGGVALALMETLADFGTVSYFGVQTFTTGIYRAWFSLGDRAAAAHLSMLLLGFVVLVLTLEGLSRGRRRFHDLGLRRPAARHTLRTGPGALAALACALPLIGGFGLPAGLLLRLAFQEGDAQFGPRFLTLAGHSVLVAACTAVLAVGLALVLAYADRVHRGLATGWAHRIGSLGYALPGTVVAVGMLIPVTQIDHALGAALQSAFGWRPQLWLTGSVAALVLACLVRYLAAAQQAVDAGLARITPNMDAAARCLGHTAPAVLRRVHLPLLRGSALTAALLVFIDVMKELPATLVMRPFNFDTLATQAYLLASDERLAEASTAALAIVAVGLLPMIIISRQIARSAASASAPTAQA
jgi:iron(III) transport system permease protein